ncbi:P1 family peptidase [Pontivivens insulae]|uniref:Putative aminopeptidase n=1 Tax=Pontivivens insulae TaxID=1639689 RepID=A0A2R8A8K4_9RHOB|nr:P1 family peptidase [Pontivivens insulae]RED18577.1 D-aminopeptidase [Pontivivens insulae]SPF28475.1 putative aminopeptidase [Pontivivens insulae]
MVDYTPGPQNGITDVSGLRVGHAQNAELKSGVTVLVADKPFVCGVHVMGGAPGTRETDLLAPDKSVHAVDALVLSGGSAFGLDAASGVMDRLAQQGRGFAVGPARVPIVPAAILFDLINGGEKNWDVNPYRALGVEALDAATERPAIGTVGSGMGAIAGHIKGGFGMASLHLPDGVIVAAMVAVNSLGSVLSSGRHFWAAPFEQENEFGGLGTAPPPSLADTFRTKAELFKRALGQGQNTTIAAVATNAILDKAGCTRLATAAHDGFARAIVPAHTPMDGDLIFGVSTAERSCTDTSLLGHAAAICLARAIARGVYAATPAANDIAPCWSALGA